MDNARLETIARLRAQDPPASWRAIGRVLGISAQWALTLHRRATAPARTAKSVARTYRCLRCTAEWRSYAKRAPDRCGVCGSYDWRLRDAARSRALSESCSRRERGKVQQ